MTASALEKRLEDLNSDRPGMDQRRQFQSLFWSLLVGFTAALLLGGFVAIGGEVLEGDTIGFDEHVLKLAQSWRSEHPAIVSAMRDLSGLGSTVVLAVFVTLSVGYLLVVSARTTAVLVVVSTVSAAALVSVLKSGFSRVRPGAMYAELVTPGLSFPSGHATMSAAVFLTIGALLASTRSRWQERAFVLFAAAVLAVLVGLSRVGLGVHWATDVLGGWAFGTAWAIAWLLAGRWLTLRAASASVATDRGRV